ncbi:YbaB/EbfC family nucleoid-associated protein [Aerococcus tenax]|uniref:YbaB/EbfC family nucleoid-associated protein n=1 Tax=Aerococcus tenax TaxID=3078812 RepID=UPI000DCCFBFD|nr:YbaB/EbfC family nucleoid-associated protein [Aerococcus tenax]WIW73271.1 YbaB/EbfC family nucleoid-associated protein [Aerococcus tenax]WOZ52918.1 YbaB/EbfC family nucleoid-associated protein [Aerococcus tenax]
MANNMMNMQKMLKEAKKMQVKLEESQKDLEKQVFEGKEPSGMIKAKVGGDRRVKAIEMDPAVIDPEDPDMLSDLLIAAVNDGLSKVDSAQESNMGNLSKGFPGF